MGSRGGFLNIAESVAAMQSRSRRDAERRCRYVSLIPRPYSSASGSLTLFRSRDFQFRTSNLSRDTDELEQRISPSLDQSIELFPPGIRHRHQYHSLHD